LARPLSLEAGHRGLEPAAAPSAARLDRASSYAGAASVSTSNLKDLPATPTKSRLGLRTSAATSPSALVGSPRRRLSGGRRRGVRPRHWPRKWQVRSATRRACGPGDEGAQLDAEERNCCWNAAAAHPRAGTPCGPGSEDEPAQRTLTGPAGHAVSGHERCSRDGSSRHGPERSCGDVAFPNDPARTGGIKSR
jgi:hypothetical protein